MPGKLKICSCSHTILAYVDSGEDGNLVDMATVLRLQLPLSPLPSPLLVCAVDGTVLPRGPIQFQTCPLQMAVIVLHQEWISFLVISKASAPLILGLPWLQLHAAHMDWSSAQLMAWGPACFTYCLSNGLPQMVVRLTHTTPTPVLPPEYHAFHAVFTRCPYLRPRPCLSTTRRTYKKASSGSLPLQGGFFLCVQKRWYPKAMYRLSGPESNHR